MWNHRGNPRESHLESAATWQAEARTPDRSPTDTDGTRQSRHQSRKGPGLTPQGGVLAGCVGGNQWAQQDSNL